MYTISADVVIVHLLLAVVLFFVVNWLGRHSLSSGYHSISLLEKVDEAPAFNFVFRVSTPLVYLAISAALLYAVGLDRYVRNFCAVVILYFAVRWLYNIVAGRGRLLNWPLQVATAAFTIGCAYVLDRKVLSIRGTLLPDAHSVNSSLWVLVIIYVYTVVNRVPFTHIGAAKRRHDYILRRYYTLHAAFAREVSSVAQSATEEALVYAVLIYETFNRPYLYRVIERWLLFPVGLSKTIGPMQVATKTPQSEAVSVREGATMLLQAFRRGLMAAEINVPKWLKDDEVRRGEYVQLAAIRSATQEYNIRGDYADEIESVYKEIAHEVRPSALPTSTG